VVLCPFSFYGGTIYQLQGRIMTSTYSPLAPAGGNNAASTLGTFDASSPIMLGVSSLTGYWKNLVAMYPGAQLVASWADGTPLAAWNHGGKVVGINLYPGENDQTGMGGDYAKLFANAIRFMTSTNLGAYVTMADYAGDPAYLNVLVELLQGGNVVDHMWGTGTPSRTIISFPAVPPGNYDVRVSAGKCLPQTVNLTLTGGSFGFAITLDNGDLNGDGSIGLLDLAILKKNWGKHA
jgi:hypothetical protein